MKNYRARFVTLIGCGMIAALAVGGAGRIASGQEAQPPQPAPYRPGMGDFMTGGVQPRHIKLAAAAAAKNWDYAAYALKEMGESFDRIVRAFPMYQQKPSADLINEFAKPQMAALDAAIKAGDAAKFKTAYSELTQACNACHVATNRAMVVVKVPGTVAAYPDQDFTPPKKK